VSAARQLEIETRLLELGRRDLELRRAEVEILRARRRAELETAAIGKFSAFVRLMWAVVEPSPLEWGPHMTAVCDALQAVAEGRCKRLIVNIPPGFSKSLLTSVFFPAWKWLRNASDRSLYLSHDAGLARRDSRRTRILLQSPEYQAILTRTGKAWKFARDQNETLNFENSARGFRYCASLGSGLTGKRGDNIVIDDPHDVKEAIEGAPERIAERMAEAAQNFDQVVQSRLNDKRTGTIVIIMQRVHEGDLTGHCMKDRDTDGNPVWETLILPMRYDPEIADPRDHRKIPGELLDPKRFPESVVAKDERALGPQASGQFGQRPVAATGGMFPVAQWVFVDHRSFPATYEREAAGWDLAFGGTNAGAYHAGIFGGKKAGKVYIYAVTRLRCEADVLSAEMLTVRQRFPKATAWHVEDAAAARPVVSVLRSKIPGLVLVPPVGDKVARAQSWQPYVASGNVVLPCTCGQSEPHHHEVAASALPADPWVRDFVAEHASFPKGTLKDQVDATSYLVKPMFEDSANQFQAPNTNAIRSAFRMR
jgi:hypothetical protein